MYLRNLQVSCAAVPLPNFLQHCVHSYVFPDRSNCSDHTTQGVMIALCEQTCSFELPLFESPEPYLSPMLPYARSVGPEDGKGIVPLALCAGRGPKLEPGSSASAYFAHTSRPILLVLSLLAARAIIIESSLQSHEQLHPCLLYNQALVTRDVVIPDSSSSPAPVSLCST